MLPVGPLMIASELQKLVSDVHVVDLVFSKDWHEALKGIKKPNVLLLSCHTIRNIGVVQAILHFLEQEWGTLRGTHVVLGGNACLELGNVEFSRLGVKVDAVIRGYGHDIVSKIASRLYGDFISAKSGADLPTPALELLDSKTHRRYMQASLGRYPIVAFGLGCLWKCQYCTAHLNADWQERPLDQVAEEARFAKQYGYRELWAVDNLFMVNPDATIEFDTAVGTLDQKWSGMTRPEIVIKQVNQLSRLENLKEVALGVESADVNLLRSVDRKSRCDPAEAFRHLAEQLPCTERTAFAVLDWPHSVESDFGELVDLLERCRPTSVSWSFYNPSAKQGLFEMQIPSSEFGFYRWPHGYSRVTPERVVQQAMWLSAKWWRGWTPLTSNSYFANGTSFGVRCKEGTVFQDRAARSPSGDIWEVWQEAREVR